MASRKMAARGDGSSRRERERSGVATGPAGTGGDAEGNGECTDSTSLLGSSCVQTENRSRFYTKCEA